MFINHVSLLKTPWKERRGLHKCIAVYRSMQIWKQSRKRQEHCCALLQRNDVAALERYRPYDVLDDTSHRRLADAQYLIARRYGFRSWANLKGLLIHSKKP